MTEEQLNKKKEEQLNEYCWRIAGYLYVEFVTPENYTIEEAERLLNKTVLPTALKKILKENENRVIEHLKKFCEKPYK